MTTVIGDTSAHVGGTQPACLGMPGGATLGGSPLAFGEKADPDQARTIQRLQAEILALREQLATKSAAEGDQVAADIRQAVKAESSGFVPVEATNCYGVKPCLHSTASDRIAAGCLEAIWEGTYGSDPTRYQQEWFTEHLPGNKTANRTYFRPLAPRSSETFRPSIGDQCDLTDAWSVQSSSHVTDATEAHWNQRLRGVKHSVWLSVGSSIDHDAMKDTCGAFGAPRVTTEAAPSVAYPIIAERPTLLLDSCYVARLNLTFAFVASNGLSTTWLSRNASLQQDRFREIGKQLQQTTPPWRGGPIFLLFGGMEWDFKNWRCAYPKSRAEWRLPLSLLHMQAHHARLVWPTSLRAVFSRTMFTPTYGQFGCPCCANESHFHHYNHLLRQAASPDVSAAYFRSAVDQSEDLSFAAGRAATCTPMHVLDMQRMMLCNNTVGSCSGRSGWSVDGLHPVRHVLLQYMSLAMNLAADLGEYCAAPLHAPSKAAAIHAPSGHSHGNNRVVLSSNDHHAHGHH